MPSKHLKKKPSYKSKNKNQKRSKAKKPKLKTFEIYLDYGRKVTNREQIQRLMFKAIDYKSAAEEGFKISRLLKRVGDFDVMKVLGIAQVDTLKKYANMPSAIGYFDKHSTPEFIKAAIKQAKISKKQMNKKNAKPKIKGKTISYVDLNEVRTR